MQLGAVLGIGALVVMLAVVTGVVPARDDAAPRADCHIHFSAVGASFTQAGQWNPRGSRLHSDTIRPRSWAFWTDADPNLELVGGWALAGQTTRDVAERADPDWFPESDHHLVILLGTNDVLIDEPDLDVGANLDHIVATADVPPERVLLLLLPPNNHAPSETRAFNDRLRQIAADRDWDLLDVGTAMDDGRGWFRTGVSHDGTHLTVPWARYVGESVAAALRAEHCR